MDNIGAYLLTTVIVFFAAAWAAAYFRKWPHKSALQQLTLIAEDRLGWTAQAILFPICFFATTLVFSLLAQRLPSGAPRGLGWVSAILFAAASLLWAPLSLRRIRYWRRAVELLSNYDPASPPDVNFGGWHFWPHTYSILAAIALMGAALALAGVLPYLGWIVACLAILGAVTGGLVWHDWPPFMNYILLLIISIGLMLK